MNALLNYSTVLFANDTTIFISGKDPKLLNESLQCCLNVANSWIFNNGLKLNVWKKQTHAHSFPKIKNLFAKPWHPARWLQDWADFVLQISESSCEWHTVLVNPCHPHHSKNVTACQSFETTILASPFLSACPLPEIIHSTMCWLLM